MTEEERLKRNAYVNEWGKKNREKVAEYSRAYRASLSPEEKVRQAEYKRQWAKARTPEEKEKDRQRLCEHMRKKRATPEGSAKVNSAVRRYVERNRDLVNARNRERRKNPTPEQRKKKNEADRLYRLSWSAEKKAADREKHREYRRLHKDWHNANNQRRRSLKKGNGGSYTAEEWKDLKAMFEHSCLCCGEREPNVKLTVDHIIPLKKGGTNDIDNLQPLCVSCNASKQDQIMDYRIYFFEEAA